PYPSDFHFNFKLGNMLPALQDFSRLALRLDIEGDYYIKPFLTAFVEAGLVIGRSEATAQRSGGTFSLVPVSAGLKYVFRSDQHVRPYAGLGLGLGILAALVDAPSNDRIGLKFNGLAGVAWLPWRRVGFNAEVSADLAGLTVNQGSNLFFGFNTNFGVLVLF
ncbi:MAG: outer membrane beta-barrel protein, partial [Myxococcales bacterium]